MQVLFLKLNEIAFIFHQQGTKPWTTFVIENMLFMQRRNIPSKTKWKNMHPHWI